MIRRVATIVLLGCSIVGAHPAFGQTSYAQKSVNIRAGVVLLDSQQIAGYQANYNPYVWYNLDQNLNIKPAGWNFTNAAAAGEVTPAIAARWGAINNFIQPGSFTPTVGERLTKRDAAYWEVTLSSATDEQLSQFDVLSVSCNGYISLNPDERGRLRRFVESGGILWVSLGNPNLDVINGFPLPFATSTTNVGSGLSADWFHPLLSYPANVSSANVLGMQESSVVWTGLRPVDLMALGFPELEDLQQTTLFDFNRFYHVIADDKGPFVSVAQIGDGYLVVTTRDIARVLNRTQRLVGNQVGNGFEANNLSVSLPYISDPGSDSAAKLAVNMAALKSGHPQYGGGSHKTNGSPIDVTAPLLRRFELPVPLVVGAGARYTPPAVFKGLGAAIVGNRLVIFDVDPSRDLDKDGNPDDGLEDYANGSTFDVVWQSSVLTAPLSPPTFAEVANSPTPNQVAVIDGSGSLQIFNAYATGDNIAPVFSQSAPAGYVAPSGNLPGPYAPTYYDGLYFVSDNANAGIAGTVGRIWVASAEDGSILTTNAPWAIGGGSVTQVQRPSSSPTVGDIPIQDGSGGTDRVVYLPTRANPAQPQTTAGIVSLWFGVRGEKPSTWSEAANQLTIVTRASLQGLPIRTSSGPDPLGVKLTVLQSNGAPLDATAMDALFKQGYSQSNGVLTFTLETGQSLPVGASLRLDYTIDWGTGLANINNSIIRGSIFLPDDVDKERMIAHHLALSPSGTLFAVATSFDADTAADYDGGTYFAFRESGRGNFQMVDRYDLYPAHTLTPNQASAINYAETLFDTDELATFAPGFLGGSFSQLRFKGGPVVVGDMVYVTARGTKAGGIVPCTIVMAFPADPPAAEILVPEITGSFTVVQPDFARNDTRSKPTRMSVLQPSQYVYESNSGNGKGRIRITALSPNQRGLIQNSISRSQPVLIRRGGQPDIFVEPDRNGPNWSTLQWYAVYFGYDNNSPANVTGGTLFFSGTSLLPAILSGLPFGSWTSSGLVAGMDAVISPSDSFLHANPTRPWLKQLWQIDVISGSNIQANPDFRWPQTNGVTSFEGWRQRLLQTVLPGSTKGFGAVAGDGTLIAWGENGVYGFSRSDFIVADENRLARFDASGNPIWSSDSTTSTGSKVDSGAAATYKKLVRPTRAYPLGARDMIVVDTGGDRVVQLDNNGREVRSIEEFQLDPEAAGHTPFIPEGFKTNAPLRLRQPRDVYVYPTYVDSASNPFENAQPLEYWVHYLIADAGNKRLIELVDRFAADPVTRRVGYAVMQTNGKPAIGLLNWHSPEGVSGQNFQYTGVTSMYGTLTSGTPIRFYAAAIGSALPTRAGVGLDSQTPSNLAGSREGNGGILVFNNQSTTTDVVNEIFIPDVAANVYWDPSAGTFTGGAVPGHMKKLNNVRSVNLRYVTDPASAGGGVYPAIMFTDNDGVYEVWDNSGVWTVRWMLPKEAYKVMRRVAGSDTLATNPNDFLPSYARRLDSGSVLVVNSYAGKQGGVNGSEFLGEVFEVDGSFDDGSGNPNLFGFSFSKKNFGFNWFSVLFQLPPVTGARGLVVPVFADRR